MQIIGEVTVRLLKAGSRRVLREERQRNLITDIGLEVAVGRLIDYEANRLTYLAVGTGATAPAAGNFKLVNEYARTPLYRISGAGMVTTAAAFFTSAEAAANIAEVGIFGGSATATRNSGRLFARALVSANNSAGLYDIHVEWSFTFAR